MSFFDYTRPRDLPEHIEDCDEDFSKLSNREECWRCRIEEELDAPYAAADDAISMMKEDGLW